VEPTGADTYVVVKTAVGLITVRAPANTKIQIGEQTSMTVSGRHNNWFDKQTEKRMTDMDAHHEP
jgi:multiple sugar transport system ATP-binding protein